MSGARGSTAAAGRDEEVRSPPQIARQRSNTQHALLPIFVPHYLQVLCIPIVMQLGVVDAHDVCKASEDSVDHGRFAPLEPAVRARARLGRVAGSVWDDADGREGR